MKKKWKKSVTLMLAVVLAGITLLSGCSSDGNATDGGTQSNNTGAGTERSSSDGTANGDGQGLSWDTIDTSEEVNLVMYLLGEAPSGMSAVMEEFNKKMKAEINATLEIRYLSWGDYTSKYPLILAAGDDVDIIYTAGWCFYTQEAGKGAYREVTQEDLSIYMPRHYEALDPTAYDQLNVDGKMYMICTSTPDKKVGCLIYRKDLCDKYEIEYPTRISEIDEYLKVVKENEPDMYPISMNAAMDIGMPFGALVNESGGMYIDILGSTVTGSGIYYDLEPEVTSISPLYENAELLASWKASAYKMKEWYDAGYLNKDIFSNEVSSRDSFEEGLSAIGFGNTIDMQSAIASSTAKGWEVGVIPLVSANRHSEGNSFLNNGVAIAATSEHPERAMMALDLLMEDVEYDLLAYFGIEGVNYVINEEGKIDNPEGITADMNTYPPDAAGLWFVNKNYHPPMAYWTDEFVAIQESMNDMLLYRKITAFTPKIDNIQTEVANCSNVIQQYAQPIYVGMIDDVDAAIETLIEKLKAAGVERIQEELSAQVDVFMKE